MAPGTGSESAPNPAGATSESGLTPWARPPLALGFGRLHSSGTGGAEPDPDASYVAIGIVRPVTGQMTKALAGDWAAFRALRG